MNVVLSIDPVRFPLTGIGRYTYELARGLLSHSAVGQAVFLSGHRLVQNLPDPTYTSTSHALKAEPYTLALRHALLKSRGVVAAHQILAGYRKRKTLNALAESVFHGPNFYLPRFPGQSVVTLHDLSIYKYEHCHPPERVRFMRKEIDASLRRAAYLITDSEFTRREVAEFFGWPLGKVRAVPLASSAEFHPRSSEEVAPVLRRHDLRVGGYCLFSGTIEPRKNIDTLLDAYESLPGSLRQRWPLVLCGYRGWRSEAIHARLDRGRRDGWLRYLGYLSAEELPLLFAGARLFAFPSLYEGFGLPVLEAMASGVPVVCSNAASLPEVAGGAALICEAMDTESLAELLRRGLEDEDWRHAAREAGLQRAQAHSWQRCVSETIAVYGDALGKAV